MFDHVGQKANMAMPQSPHFKYVLLHSDLLPHSDSQQFLTLL